VESLAAVLERGEVVFGFWGVADAAGFHGIYLTKIFGI